VIIDVLSRLARGDSFADRDGQEGLMPRVDLPGHSLELEHAASFRLDVAIMYQIFFALALHS
jgi:hypothetical protein